MPLKGAPAVGRTNEGEVDPTCRNGERTRAMKVVYPRNPNEGIRLHVELPMPHFKPSNILYWSAVKVP